MPARAIGPDRVHEFVSTIFAEDLHAKRVASLADEDPEQHDHASVLRVKAGVGGDRARS